MTNSLNLGCSVLSRHKPGENRGAIGLGSFRFVCLKQTQVGPKIGLVCLDLGSFHNADFGLFLAFKRSSGCNLGRLRWFGFGFDHSIPNPGFAAGQAYWDQRLEPIHRIGFVPADSCGGAPLLKVSSRASTARRSGLVPPFRTPGPICLSSRRFQWRCWPKRIASPGPPDSFRLPNPVPATDPNNRLRFDRCGH